MSTNDTPLTAEPQTPTLPPAIRPEAPPLWPKNLLDLFFQPRSFFSKRLALGHLPNLFLVTWCFGASNVIGRIDTELMRADLGHPRPGWETFSPFIVQSWLGFWLWVLAMGAVGGAMIWWIGGWWYGVRLRWSGVASLDKRLARLVFIYSSFVFTGPTVLFTIGQTVAFPHYAAAYAAEEWFSTLLLVFPFWSIATSYIAVRTLFPVVRWKAITWFIVLPAIAYVIAFGVIAALFAFLDGGAGAA